MAKYRNVWGELVLVVALIVLSTLHYKGVTSTETLYRILLLIGLFYIFHLLSPAKIIMGNRSVRHDLAIISAFILMAGQSAFPFIDEIANSSTIVAGALLLAFTSLSASYRLPASKTCILAVFKMQKAPPFKRAVWSFLFLLGFFVVFFQPIIQLTFSLSQVPLLRPLASCFVLIALLQEQRVLHVQVFRRIGVFAERLGKDFLALFTKQRTFLLGITGLLVLHFTLQVVTTVPFALADAFAGFQNPLQIVAAVVSAFGTIILFLLPLYVWYKTFRVRKSHEHLPDWNRGVVSVVLAGIVAALIFPVTSLLSVERGYGAIAFAKISTNDPMLALSTAFIVLIVCFIIGSLDEYLRRALMIGPFLAAVAFLGVYVYRSFVSTFVFAAQQLLASIEGTLILAIPLIVMLFVAKVVFLIAGYLSFLYEIWRE